MRFFTFPRSRFVFLGVFLFIFSSSAGGLIQGEATANEAARTSLIQFSLNTEIAGQKAPRGKNYILHVILNFFDRAFLLADGQIYSLDRLTDVIPGGYALNKNFAIPEVGDRKRVQLAYLVPAEAENIAFQFFNYSNGHILVPVKGDQRLAVGKSAPAVRFLDQIKVSLVEIAAQAVRFEDTYKEEEAPEGWRMASSWPTKSRSRPASKSARAGAKTSPKGLPAPRRQS